ncbi:MAG: tetratricopeptide repeat protein [Anaerolineae bacterium]|nr:tetratricopeptide repeat protein [Anaerolineae bacterium]
MNRQPAQPPPLADSYEGLFNRARARYQAGEMEEAIELYQRLTDKLGRLTERILARRPELGEMRDAAQFELADALYQLNRFAEALEEIEALIAREPKGVEVLRRNKAVLLVLKGEVDAGLAELYALAEANPEDLRIWLDLAGETLVEGRLAESQAAIERALEAGRAQEDEDILARAEYQRFLLLKELGQIDEATGAWEEAVGHDAEAEKTVREVYEMLTEAGRYTEALEYVARDENELQAGFQRGLIAHATARPVDARDAWREVAAMDPDAFGYGHDAWVEAVLRLRDPVPALEWLERGLSPYGTPRLFVLAGIAWAMQGDTDLAARMFQQALRLKGRERPAKKKLESADWRLLNMLVTDDGVKKGLRSYFAVVETIWGM